MLPGRKRNRRTSVYNHVCTPKSPLTMGRINLWHHKRSMNVEQAQHVEDTRRLQLQTWVQDRLPDAGGLYLASEDASFRRHFRVEGAGGHGWLAIDAPPEHENTAAYVDIAARLRACGLHVPEVRAADAERGFLLVSDLGRDRFQEVLQADNADLLYEAAAAALVRMQECADVNGLPDYDECLLQAEMQLFEDWLLNHHLELRLSATERRMLHATRTRLAAAALAQPRVFVHRDYHSRNLMHTSPNPGILDFQDAVRGPYTYDLVSLLKDCYLHWPGSFSGRVERYLELAAGAGLAPIDPEVYVKDLHLMGAQRHLKAAGIFARLMHRDGKPAYLSAIPRTLGYVAALKQPETAELAAWITGRVLPAVESTCAP